MYVDVSHLFSHSRQQKLDQKSDAETWVERWIFLAYYIGDYIDNVTDLSLTDGNESSRGNVSRHGNDREVTATRNRNK